MVVAVAGDDGRATSYRPPGCFCGRCVPVFSFLFLISFLGTALSPHAQTAELGRLVAGGRGGWGPDERAARHAAGRAGRPRRGHVPARHPEWLPVGTLRGWPSNAARREGAPAQFLRARPPQRCTARVNRLMHGGPRWAPPSPLPTTQPPARGAPSAQSARPLDQQRGFLRARPPLPPPVRAKPVGPARPPRRHSPHRARSTPSSPLHGFQIPNRPPFSVPAPPPLPPNHRTQKARRCLLTLPACRSPHPPWL